MNCSRDDGVEADAGDVEEEPPFELPGVDRAVAAVERDVDRRVRECVGTPISWANPLPEPAGRSRERSSVPASAVPISLIVPSPPQAITIRAPASTRGARELAGVMRAVR